MSGGKIWRASGVWAFLGALALAALYGRAALLNLTTAVVGGDIDGYENIWSNWWVKTALLDLHRSFFSTDYLYYPYGISLRFHALNPFNGLVAIPFNTLLGYVPTMNLQYVAALTLTTFFTFLFIRELVGNPWAAFAGAALFTYANRLVVGYYIGGQMNLLSREWLPLYLLFLWRVVQGAHWRRDAALAVVVLLITSLTEWQYVMFAVFLTLVYFVFLLCTRRTWAAKAAIFGKCALIGGTYALIALPLLVWPMIQEALANPWLNVSGQSQLHALDLRDLLVPGLGNPGYLAVAVALLGLLTARAGRDREAAGFWALAAGLFYLIALGPTLLWDGQATGVPLPYALLQNLPVLNVGRDPWQFSNLAILGVGVLAAFGLRWILDPQWLRALVRRRVRSTNPPAPIAAPNQSTPPQSLTPSPYSLWLAGGVTTLFLALSLAGFVAATDTAVADAPDWPPFYQQIAHDPDQYAILELPLFTEKGRGEDHYQVYQVLHQKPRFGGRWSRDHKLTNPHNFVKTASLFRQLWALDLPSVRAAAYPARDFLQRTNYAAQGRAILNYYQVRYIVVYKDALDRDWDAAGFAKILVQILGPNPAPYYEDAQMRVYRVPPADPPANPLTLDVGEGWFPSETRSNDGKVYRLADSSGGKASQLYTMNLTAQPVTATLYFTVYDAFQQPRTLNVALDGAALTTLPITGAQTVSLQLTLPPGNNMITFSTPEAARPTGNPADNRLLTFGMFDVSLEAQ